jgi:transcriptional regulator with PAS, ATPase and Fis domain
MQKEKIRKNLGLDLKTIASFFDEDIIIINKELKVAYLNDYAKKSLKIEQYKQNETHCKEVFQDLCPNCSKCHLENLNPDSKKNIVFPFDNEHNYEITAQYIPSDLFEQDYILCKGKKIIKPAITTIKKINKAWKLKIDIDHKIIDTDAACSNFTNYKKNEILNSNIVFSSFIKPEYIPSFKRLHQKVIDSGKYGETLSIIKNSNSELRVVLKLTPNSKNNFTNCSIQVIPFLKTQKMK